MTMMKRLNRTLTTWLGIAVLLVCTAAVFAHGGFDHVRGTVIKATHHILTVKTLKGNMDVELNDKTELTQSDRKAELADLTPGARVVVEIPQGSKDHLAHSVKIGVGGKTVAQIAKGSHK